MKKQKKKEINYQAFFISGIIFMGAGAVFAISVNPGIGAALIALGVIWMLIGGKNKDKWGKKQIKNKREKKA